MLVVSDEANLIDELSNAQMNFRTEPQIKGAIQKAAALSGVGYSALSANCGAAKQSQMILLDRIFASPINRAADLYN